MRTEHVVKEGDSLILPCPAVGAPKPQLIFTKTGGYGVQTARDLPLGADSLGNQLQSINRRSVLSQVSLRPDHLAWSGE
ncbi:unnamed protein product [Protopolystoma xenopodis]|uniref:Immunoglobulin-like beta-sandwich domain-containing protein n=1 Tax=Protopolystoma xenopodis TaxID=117903 RepID=A0A448XG09_9PLAT|nr:unnamed protein product [Protopolystoma xenopodis]